MSVSDALRYPQISVVDRTWRAPIPRADVACTLACVECVGGARSRCPLFNDEVVCGVRGAAEIQPKAAQPCVLMALFGGLRKHSQVIVVHPEGGLCTSSTSHPGTRTFDKVVRYH